MRQPIATGIFNPTLNKAESKSDTTNRVAREISQKETARQTDKTARLRAAREAREAEEAPAIAAKAVPRKRKSK